MAATKTRSRLKFETLESREVPSATPDLLSDVNAGVGSSNPMYFAEVAGGVIFTANNGTATKTYFSDKTPNTPEAALTVINETATSQPVVFGSLAYYGGGIGGLNTELYRTNGTTTARVLDLNPGGASSNPQFLTPRNTIVNPFLFFVATTAANGRELFKTTGSINNASIVTDLTNTTGSTVFDSVHTVNDITYAILKVNGVGGWTVYQVNSAGTVMSQVTNTNLALNALPAGFDIVPTSFVRGTDAGGAETDLYFVAKNATNTDHGIYRLNTQNGSLREIRRTAVTTSYDGANPLAFMGGYLYFSETASGHRELYRYKASDGTFDLPGTIPTLDLNPTGNADVQGFQTINDEVYFVATVGGERELWRTDGTGVFLAANVSANTGGSSPTKLTAFNGQLVFVAKDDSGVDTLYRYDPVNKTAPFAATGGSFSFGEFTVSGQSLYMQMGSAAEGLEPYHYDPAPDAPKLDANFTPDTGFGTIGSPAVLDSNGNSLILTLTDHVTNFNGNAVSAPNVSFSGRANAAGQVIQLFYRRLTPTAGTITALGGGFAAGLNGVWTTPANLFTLPPYAFPPDTVGGNFTNGTFEVTATASDATATSVNSGTVSVDPYTVIIDQTAPITPTITGNVAGPGIDLTTSDNTVTISGTAEPNTEPDPMKPSTSYVNLYEDTPLGPGLAVPLIPLIPVDSFGNWSVTTSALLDGIHEFYVEGQDVATNRSLTTSTVYRVDLDATSAAPPVIDNFSDNTGNTGDNITSDQSIILSGTAESLATVTIYLAGTPTPLGTASADIDGNWSFNVFDTIGNLVPDGTYVFRATATDVRMNPPSALSADFAIVIDTIAPPQATIDPTITTDTFNPAIPGTATDLITSDTTLVLTGTAESGSILTIRDNGVIIGQFPVSGSTWTFNAGSAGNPLTGTPGGFLHSFTATSNDVAGNSFGASAALNVIVDTLSTLPTATFSPDTGTVGDNRTNQTTLTLSGTADDGAIVTIQENGVTLPGGVLTATGGVWTLPNVSAPAGTHTYTVRAVDVAGNVSALLTMPTITVDVTPPGTPTFTGFTVDSGTGPAATDFLTNDTDLTLTGTAEIGSTVILRENGNPVGNPFVVPANGIWTIATGVLPDGAHNFTATATDAAGNVSGTPLTIPTITIDATAPAAPVFDLTITNDSANPNLPGTDSDRITNDRTPAFSGTIVLADGVIPTGVKLYLDGSATPLPGNAVLTGNTWTYQVTSDIPDGVHTIRATATDLAPNTSLLASSTPLTFTIDRNVPSAPPTTGQNGITFSTDSGVSGDRRTNDNTLTLSGILSGEVGSTVNVFIQGNATAIGHAVVMPGVPSPTWSFTTDPLPDGNYTFRFSSADIAGNTSGTQPIGAIIIDTTVGAPVITGITDDTGFSPSDGYTRDNNIVVSGTAEAGATVQIYDGVTFKGNAVFNDPSDLTKWTFSNLVLSQGSHSLTAVARDTVTDLTSSPSAPFVVVVDTMAPPTPVFTGYTVDSGTVGDNLTNDTTPTFSGTGEDDTVVTIREGATVIGFATIAGGVWSITPSTPFADGVHIFTSTAIDLAGNAAAAAPAIPTLTIDTIAPPTQTVNGFEGLTPVGFNTFGSLTSATTIRLTGSSAEEGLTVKVFDDDDGGVGLPTELATVTSGPGGIWTYETGVLADGVHNFTASSSDVAGNFSAPSPALSVTIESTLTIDNEPPVFLEDSGSKILKGSDLLAKYPSDDTTGALKGVAITALSGGGTWSYSTKGTTFVTLPAGGVSTTRALLLRDTDSLKFTPAANFTGVVRITFNAWDQTGGRPGEYGNLTTTGNLTPYSTASKQFKIGVRDSNDRPTLLLSDSPLLPSISANVGAGVSNTGGSVASLLAGRFQDADSFTKPGIAIIGVSGSGRWQFRLSSVPTWTDIVAPSATRAVLLNETHFVRFVPASGVRSVAKLTYKGWDGSTGNPGTTGVSTTTSTAFSTLAETVMVNVGNSAPFFVVPTAVPPALPAPAQPSFPTLTEDPKTNAGTAVSALLSKRFGDNDQNAVGLAVTGVDESFGKWEFSTGTTWRSLTGASATRVLLLSATNKIRFVPNANQSGTATISIRAWDGTTGIAGDWANPTGNNAFSAATQTASMVVTPVNDSPVLVTTGTPLLPSLGLNSGANNITGTRVSDLIGGSLTDVETAMANIGIAVVGTKGAGSWQYNRTTGVAGGTAQGWFDMAPVSPTGGVLLLPSYFVRFVPSTTTGPAQLASLTFKGWDTSFGIGAAGGGPNSTTRVPTTTALSNNSFSTNTETAYVSVGNTAPALAAGAAFPALAEDPKTNGGTGVKTLLTDKFTQGTAIAGKGQGIAITAVDNTSGKWQYAIGAVFVDIPATVSATHALLLPDTAKLKFVPNLDFNGSLVNTVTYKAWDRSVGVAGEYADTTNDRAFSTDSVTPTLNVTAVNDRPVVAPGTATLLTPLATGVANPAGDDVKSLVPASAVTEPADELLLSPDRGIAVTGLAGAGAWQYSLDNGANWLAVTATAGKAFLLDADWKVRFLATDTNAVQTATITYKAWDMSGTQTAGTSVAVAATDTAFSTGLLTATLSIGNAAPEFVP